MEKGFMARSGMMDWSDIVRLRHALRFTQENLAAVMGVHSITVSKWECGKLIPSYYQLALMKTFQTTYEEDDNLVEWALRILKEKGAVSALYVLMSSEDRNAVP